MTSHDARRQVLRDELLRQRREIATLGRLERDAVRTEAEAGRFIALDEAEASALDLQAEIDFALLEMRTEAIAHIDHALDRIDAGTYGVCDDCGREIPVARLRALLAAERCRSCEESRESLHEKRQSFGANRFSGMPFVTAEP